MQTLLLMQTAQFSEEKETNGSALIAHTLFA